MPRKVRPPADTAQNRANQQRSRARRRAYVAGLEARVREFEGREVRASLAMQRAAREVAWVNARLMEMLAEKGVARGEVEEFLRRAGGDGRGGVDCGFVARGGSFGVGSVGGEKGGECARSDARESGIGERDVVVTGMGMGMGMGMDMDMGASEHAVDEDVRDRTAQTLKWCDGNVVDGPPALVTSCDDAASIIADFQGHGDVSRARGVLGCGDIANCHVKNTRLFQLMDEAGGS
ncbi:hypothetical protein F4859DRAFT_509610 [Xylaria cf. heliscus]|nr:hypothetical protein F4859DRAFT_509610 [Xylaria cf. heliscus]